MSKVYSHFSAISRAPRPVSESPLFTGKSSGASYDNSGIAEQLSQLVDQVQGQSSLLNELVGQVTGKQGSSAGSAVQSVLGGSVLGNLAGGGFSFSSLLKDIFPLGGLISGIAGLFSSAPTPPPLQQYDAPVSLNFDAVLGADGGLSQGSTNQYGYTRGSSSGLDLMDAAGGPYSPYARLANGSLAPTAGDATSRYTGDLNLSDAVRSIAAPVPVQAPPTAPVTTQTSTPVDSGASANVPAAATPAFDANWFNDHGSLIASAVRNQLLNFHPIVDTINDL